MPAVKLTDALLKSTERPEKGTITLWDTELKGFVAHVQKTATTLYYNYNNQRHLIGRYPAITMPLAREAARELEYKLRRGFAKHVTPANPYIGDLAEQYCARPKLRSEKWKAFVRHAIAEDLKWSKRRVLDITPSMCQEAHLRLYRRGPTAANQILQVFSTVWNYGRRIEPSLPECPARGLEWFPEQRSLNRPIHDLRAWHSEVEKVDNLIHRTAYIFALFTGLRRGELEGLEWSRIDDAIYFPTTKSGREFYLPLTPYHHELLSPVRGLHERWVFPADSKSGHIVSWDHDNVPGTLHSLRHTFATTGVEAGIPEEVVGRLLNHAAKSITGQRYVRPKLDFMRGAMATIVAELGQRLNSAGNA